MTHTREYHRGAIAALKSLLPEINDLRDIESRTGYETNHGTIDDVERRIEMACDHHFAALAAMPEEPPAPDWELVKRLEKTITGLLLIIPVCEHYNTHRGGAIWTICSDCGREWADDDGGFKPDPEAKEVTAARAALVLIKERKAGK